MAKKGMKRPDDNISTQSNKKRKKHKNDFKSVPNETK